MPSCAHIGKAADAAGYPFGAMFKMLAITGQHRNEVSDARWNEINLERLWTVPAARMKDDSDHLVPLDIVAVALLDGLPRLKEGDFIFSTTFGRVPVSDFSKAKARLNAGFNKIMPIERPFVIHDIRRTMRIGLSALPIADIVRELVIAHTKQGLHNISGQSPTSTRSGRQWIYGRRNSPRSNAPPRHVKKWKRDTTLRGSDLYDSFA